MTDARDVLAPATTMGAVTLAVADLDTMVAYYRGGVGLDLLAEEGGRASLGRNGRTALVLEQRAELRHASPSQAGLYHTAFLFADQADLAASVYSVATRYGGSFTGSSDHLVSKALYFDDPEGNGVELYWDRPRDEWRWRGGSVEMGTVFLDPNRFLAENLTDTGAEAGPSGDAGVGHVHLKVGDIATAKAFYVDTLGFEVTAAFGDSALFVSAGGYHHHLGMNTWHSAGAGTRTPALGLGQVSVTVPAADDLGALRERLTARRIGQRDTGDAVTFEDPWANTVRVTVGA
ncbi:VOC family protein [Naasia aerilata]|nr:VOC family protein [Naasia aerilata]